MTTVFIIIAFLVIFPLFWMAITYLIAQMSGWAMMAKNYRTDTKPKGYSTSMSSGTIGWSRYNGVLHLIINEEGLYISILQLFSFGHPALFIPWEHIELKGKIDYWIVVKQQLIVLTPNGRKITELRLSRRFFEEARDIIPYSIDREE